MPLRPPAVALAVALALVCGLLGGLGPASAAPSEEEARKAAIDQQVEAMRGELAGTSRRLADAAVALEQVQAQLPDAQQAVATARAEAAAAQARDEELAGELEVAVAEVDKAERELTSTISSMGASEDVIGRIARESYQTGDLGSLAVVLQTRTPEDLADRLSLSQSAIRSQGVALAELAVARAELANSRASLQAKRDQVAGMKAEQERVVETKRRLEGEAVVAQQRVTALIEAQRQALAVIEAERVAEQQRIAEMEAESARLQAILVERARIAREKAAAEAAARAAAERAAAERAAAERAARAARQNAPAPPREEVRASRAAPSGNGRLLTPVRGRVSSSYGMRLHPVTGVYKMHDGMDFAAPSGTPIYAAAAGEVVAAHYAGGYGNQVVIDHGFLHGVALATSYAHQSRMAVRAGQQVAAGDVIGYVGSTGLSSGPHLHFMVYVDGSPVNPAGWL